MGCEMVELRWVTARPRRRLSRWCEIPPVEGDGGAHRNRPPEDIENGAACLDDLRQACDVLSSCRAHKLDLAADVAEPGRHLRDTEETARVERPTHRHADAVEGDPKQAE